MANKHDTWLSVDFDVDEVLARKRHPSCPVYSRDTRLVSLEYAIYRYVNEGASVVEIGKELQCKHYATVTYWLKKVDVFEKSNTERKRQADPKRLRTKNFETKAKSLHDNGIITYAAIARELKCGETIIRNIAIKNGWAHETKIPKFKWIVPKELPENTAVNYKRYKSYIYYFTKHIVQRYFTEEERARLSRTGDHVDHKLSVYDAWNRGLKPLPWQMICHPANLQIITCHENVVKNRHSILNPKQLQLEILAFEQTKGKVKLPIEVFTET